MGQLPIASRPAWGLLSMREEEEAVVVAEAWNRDRELSVYYLVAVHWCSSLELVLGTVSLVGGGVEVGHIVGAGVAVGHTAGAGVAVDHTVGDGVVVDHTVGAGIVVDHTARAGVAVGHTAGAGVAVGHTAGAGVEVGHID